MKPVKVRIVKEAIKGDESQTIEHHYSGQFAEKQGEKLCHLCRKRAVRSRRHENYDKVGPGTHFNFA